MALVKCKECGQQISTDAKACPSCGKKRTSSGTMGCAVILLICLVGFLVSLFTGSGMQTGSTPISQSPREDAARGACLNYLQKNLHDPDGAKIGSTQEWYVESRADGTILVQPTAHVKNHFGAYREGTWNCVTKSEDGKVSIQEFKQIKP